MAQDGEVRCGGYSSMVPHTLSLIHTKGEMADAAWWICDTGATAIAGRRG